MKNAGGQKENNYWQERREAKEFYSSIGKVVAPAFNGEKIAFNAIGFTHLIRKRGILRPEKEQIRRFKLLRFVISIIRNNETISEYRSEEARGSKVEFWTLEKVIGKQIITVVIRKIGNGRRHFFSVMNEYFK